MQTEPKQIQGKGFIRLAMQVSLPCTFLIHVQQPTLRGIYKSTYQITYAISSP